MFVRWKVHKNESGNARALASPPLARIVMKMNHARHHIPYVCTAIHCCGLAMHGCDPTCLGGLQVQAGSAWAEQYGPELAVGVVRQARPGARAGAAAGSAGHGGQHYPQGGRARGAVPAGFG